MINLTKGSDTQNTTTSLHRICASCYFLIIPNYHVCNPKFENTGIFAGFFKKKFKLNGAVNEKE